MHLQDCIRYDCTYSKYTMYNDGWSERVGPSNKIASWGINTRRKMSGGEKKNHNRGYYKQIKEKKLLDQRWEETAEGSITWIRSSIHRSDWIGGENPGSGSDTILWLLIWRFSFSGPKPRARNHTCEKPSGRTGRGVEESVSVRDEDAQLHVFVPSIHWIIGVVTICTWKNLWLKYFTFRVSHKHWRNHC